MYTRQTGRTIGEDQFIYLPGTQTALYAAMMTVIDEGDEVLMADPYYATYEGVIAAAGGIVRAVPAPGAADKPRGFFDKLNEWARAEGAGGLGYIQFAADGPKGPIANPGKASIAAVLDPEANDYLFFVAKGDGGHVFARTLSEHNANVQKWYQLRRDRGEIE